MPLAEKETSCPVPKGRPENSPGRQSKHDNLNKLALMGRQSWVALDTIGHKSRKGRLTKDFIVTYGGWFAGYSAVPCGTGITRKGNPGLASWAIFGPPLRGSFCSPGDVPGGNEGQLAKELPRL